MTDLFRCTCPHCGQPMPEEIKDASFSEFWQKVPQKVGKAQAEKAWKRLRSGDRQIASERVGDFYSKWRSENPTASWLHPATYLNNRRWEDYEPQGTKATGEKRAMLEKMLQSPVPSVREYAEEQLKR